MVFFLRQCFLGIKFIIFIPEIINLAMETKNTEEVNSARSQLLLISLRRAIAKDPKQLKQIAEESGISYNHLARVTRGGMRITKELKGKIEKVLNVTL
jgi:DNA-binding phage protein